MNLKRCLETLTNRRFDTDIGDPRRSLQPTTPHIYRIDPMQR